MLTALKVAKVTEPGDYPDGNGLNLQVTAGKKGTGKSWLFRFTSPETRKKREMGFGAYPETGLADARKKRDDARALVRKGIDPIAERERQRAKAAAYKPSFESCAAQYFEAHESSWRSPKHRAQWEQSLRDHAKPIAAMPVDVIGTEQILATLQPLWKSMPETAGRVRQRIERVLDWARVKGFRQGENPCRWRGHLDHLLPAKAKIARAGHFKAMAYQDVPEFMSRLAERTDIASKALALAILTAARTGEVTRATWQEIDLEARTWTIPVSRMKGGREHRVPLSDPAMAVLRHMAGLRANEFVFPSFNVTSTTGAMDPAGMWRVLRDMSEDCTVHGFRSAFRDWAAEQTSFPREVCEQALAHRTGDATELAYRRGDALEKRRALMAAWASYCGQGAKIVRLATAR